MKAYAIAIIGALLSFGTFYYFFESSVEIQVSSGHNARLRGLFQWYYSYTQFDYASDETSSKKVLTGSGRDIRPLSLALEILMSVVLGYTCAWIISLALPRRTRLGEQGPLFWPLAAVFLGALGTFIGAIFGLFGKKPKV